MLLQTEPGETLSTDRIKTNIPHTTLKRTGHVNGTLTIFGSAMYDDMGKRRAECSQAQLFGGGVFCNRTAQMVG